MGSGPSGNTARIHSAQVRRDRRQAPRRFLLERAQCGRVDTGVDAWWPDEGDWFSFHEHEISSITKGPSPKHRTRSLHHPTFGRGALRGWIWSSDTHASFKTLEAQIAVGINHSLSLSPFWGSDIGFYPTQDLTGELYARWFQFDILVSRARTNLADATALGVGT